jgi:hypothetical protein
VTPIPPPPVPSQRPGTPEGPDALLAAALAAHLADDREGGAPVPVLDPGAEAARLEGLLAGGDAASGDARRGDLALLLDLVAAEATAEAHAAGGRAPLLGEHVRRAVIEAGAATEAATAAPLPARRDERGVAAASARRDERADRPGLRSGLALAALVLATLGASFVLRGAPAEAEPTLALAGLERWSADPAASSAVWRRAEQAGPRVLRAGERLTTNTEELLALALAGGGRLGVARGGVASVALTRVPQPGSERAVNAVLSLAGGEALLDAERGFAALILAPAKAGALLLEPADEGAPLGLLLLAAGHAHVALPTPCTEGACEPALALAPGARARWLPARGEALDLSGPLEARLSSGGAAVSGVPDRALFRDLDLLGGALKAGGAEPVVDARLWRAVAGRVKRGGEGLKLEPGADVVLAWTPDASASGARVLRVLLDAASDLGGLVVSLPDFGVNATLPADAAAEPGVGGVDLALPDGWAERLAGGDLRVSFAWPPSPEAVRRLPSFSLRFHGATLGRWPLPESPR